MKRLTFAGVFWAAAISMAPISTNAAIIDYGTYTTVTDIGLDWLDLTQTSNRTYADILSQLGAGGEFEGWRYAHTTEIIALLDAFGGDGVNTYYNPGGNNGLLTALAPHWGDLKCVQEGCTPGDGESNFIFWQNPTGGNIRTGNINDVSQINIHTGLDVSLTADIVNIGGFLGATNISNVLTGHALVRGATAVVPVPAAIWLFGTALLGLFGARYNR